jgi:hypothetical protein
MDKSAERMRPQRRIEVRENQSGKGYLLIAVTRRPDGGSKETILVAVQDKRDARLMAEGTARCVEHLTGEMFSYE